MYILIAYIITISDFILVAKYEMKAESIDFFAVYDFPLYWQYFTFKIVARENMFFH